MTAAGSELWRPIALYSMARSNTSISGFTLYVVIFSASSLMRSGGFSYTRVGKFTDPVESDAMSGRWCSMPPRSEPTPERPPVENWTIISGQCFRIPARKRANFSGSDVVVPSSLRT